MSYDIEFGVQTVCENNDGERFEQPPVDRLIRCLENDYGITASWDGLRKVWLTERATLGRQYMEASTGRYWWPR